jgi:hypothetical protein
MVRFAPLYNTDCSIAAMCRNSEPLSIVMLLNFSLKRRLWVFSSLSNAAFTLDWVLELIFMIICSRMLRSVSTSKQGFPSPTRQSISQCPYSLRLSTSDGLSSMLRPFVLFRATLRTFRYLRFKPLLLTGKSLLLNFKKMPESIMLYTVLVHSVTLNRSPLALISPITASGEYLL